MDYKDRTDLPEDVLKAIAEFERIKEDPDLQMEALSKQIAILDYIQGLEDATNKGIKEGIKEGILEGLERTAKRMKEKGADIDYIIEMTGLDLETIEKL